MKARNLRYYSTDKELLEERQTEYRDYGDWDTDLSFEDNLWVLTIFSVHRKYRRAKEKAAREKRDKRKEKFARRRA